MLISLIQSILFLSISITTHTMEIQKADQRAIVRSMLTEKYAITETPQCTHTTIQPLSEIQLDRSTIRRKHIQLAWEDGNNDQALISYKKIASYIPDDLSILKPKTKENYQTINNSIKKIAFEGNIQAQQLVTEKSVERISPLFQDSQFIKKIKNKSCSYAFDLLNFTLDLKNNNMPINITEDSKRELIKLRDVLEVSDAATSCIIRAILYLQSPTDAHKQIRLNFFNEHHCPENPEIKIACEFLINYGDTALSAEDTTKKFIQAITCQKKISHLLSEIAHTPLAEKIITKLRNTELKHNDALLEDLNYVIAELYYANKDYKQAHIFYQKNTVKYLKAKNLHRNVFTAYLASSKSFCKDDITYLSSLVGNIGDQLKKLEKTDQKVSYNIGLLTQALIENNSTMNVVEKTTLLHNALDHLAYAQKDTPLNIEFHTLLSSIYEDKNDSITSLKHMKHALEFRSHYSNNIQDSKICSILTQAEKNDPELYVQYASWTKTMLHCINNQEHTSKQKNYSLLIQFATSDLCSQLLPYCKINKKTNNDMICLMAFVHKNNGNHQQACDYIDTLSQPISTNALLLKSSIYITAQKTLSYPEMETVIKLFINNKKPSINEQDTVLSLIMLSQDFFIQSNNHALALKLITKLTDLQNTPQAAILLAYYVTLNLIETNNPYFKKWQEGLNNCQFYTKIKDQSCYNGATNDAIGLLLMQKKPLYTDYEKIISHFTAAIDSKELLPETVEITRKTCGTLYYNWATSVKHDKETFTRLIDIAIYNYKNSKARYKKAVFLLQNGDTQNLINHALELLEENIKNDIPEKAPSQLQLARAYFNYSPDPARLPLIQESIPLDTDKALSYLKEHNNNTELLSALTNIYCAISSYITSDAKEKYKDLKEALHCINLLINSDSKNVDYIINRMYIHSEQNDHTKIIADINLLLTFKDLSNTYSLTREKLLQEKIKYLLIPDTVDDETYDEILACLKELTFYATNMYKNFDGSFLLHERTRQLIKNNNMSKNAIEWCCFTAESYINADTNQPVPETTPEQKDLAYYLLSAAEKGNLNAQLTLLLYLNAINYLKVDMKLFIKSLQCAHTALTLNPPLEINKAKTCALLEFLHDMTCTTNQDGKTEGSALAYYILCDCYKKDPQQLEKVMLHFSRAKIQQHYLDDATDTIEEICSSCKSTLWTYVNRYLTNPSKGSLIDALATFTLGSMYHYSNTRDLLTAGTFYLNKSTEQLCTKFKLHHFQIPSQVFLANTYYKNALLDEKHTKTVNIELLRKSVQLCFPPAIHKMAKLYIEQQEDKNSHQSIKLNDFFSLLKKDVQTTPNDPYSTSLLEKIIALEAQVLPNSTIDTSEKKIPSISNKDSLKNKDLALIHKTSAVEDRMTLLTQHATKKNMLKHIQYKEASLPYSTALQLQALGNYKESAVHLQKAIAKENHPCAYMMFALNHLTGQGVNKDYSLSEKLLNQALSHGLLIKARKNKTKQFHSVPFLNLLLYYIEALVTLEHPLPIKSHLLSTIKKTLINDGINLADFCEIVNENIDTDLSLDPEWVAEKKGLIKHLHYKENSPLFLAALNASELGSPTKASLLMEDVATQEAHPSACLAVACNYLRGNGVQQNYDLSEKFLQDALVYGLIEKQFCHIDFLHTLCSYIDMLLPTTEHLPIKQRLLSRIKQTLIDEGINLTDFYKTFEEITKIKLFLVPEWTAKNITIHYEKNPTNLCKLFEKNLLLIPNSLIKDPNYKETSPDLLSALQAYDQGKEKKALDLMHLAAAEKHPNACILLAGNYLAGAGTKQSYSLSEKYLAISLGYGLTTKQFCNNDVLKGLCDYIEELLTQPQPRIAKQNLLSAIKKRLEEQAINPKDFYAAFKQITTIDLSSKPEWTTENTSQEMKILTSLRNNLIKHIDYKETSIPYTLATAAFNQEKKEYGVTLIKKAAAENHPNACLFLAANSLTGDMLDKNYDASENFLNQALTHGIITKQFYNKHFLDMLFYYIDMVLMEPDQPQIKQRLLSIIKSALETNEVNFTIFSKILQETTGINLSLIPEWSTKQEKKSSRTATILLKKHLLKDPDYKETSTVFLNALLASQQKEITEYVVLTHLAATKEKHPTACLLLARIYLDGKDAKKSYNLSEKFLLFGLKYGLTEKQFCNNAVLKGLCGYIKELLTKPQPRIAKQKLLSIIKQRLDEESINHQDFCEAFQEITTIDLSSKPEWTTENNSQEMKILTNLKNSLIKHRDYKETNISFTLASQAHKEEKSEYALQCLIDAAAQHYPTACLLLAANYLIGQSVKTNYDASEDLLNQALTHGLITKQFYNNEFLDVLYYYIEMIFIEIDKPHIKQRFLSTIRKALETNEVNLTLFSKIFQETTGINLSLIPEWSDICKTNTTNNNEINFIAVETNNPNDPALLDFLKAAAQYNHTKTENTITSLMSNLNTLEKVVKKPGTIITLLHKLAVEKNMIKHTQYKETSLLYIKATKLEATGKHKEATAIFKKCCNKERHTCSYMSLAINYLITEDITQDNYNVAENLLRQALDHGLLSKTSNSTLKQFHSSSFLLTFVQYVGLLIIQGDPLSQNLLSVIKTTLVKNGINISDFCEIFQALEDTDLSQVPGWLAEEKKKPKKPLVSIPNSFLKNPDHKETSFFFLNGMQARHEQKMSKYLVLMQEAARKDNHPVAYIMLASNYLKEDNIKSLKEVLCDGLIYGLTTQQFCNRDILISLCGFINGLITGPYQKYRKELLTIIKNELIKNDISLTIFYEIFQELTTIKLPSVPEWND